MDKEIFLDTLTANLFSGHITHPKLRRAAFENMKVGLAPKAEYLGDQPDDNPVDQNNPE
ncbi:MAG: hypothetical protein ACTS9Y_00185 [Methylophilus sp.]|uniref:hypothetical protein n=1 Tax=Methylophilus sp. TaxID=29541 RepID=UPI003F9F1EF1